MPTISNPWWYANAPNTYAGTSFHSYGTTIGSPGCEPEEDDDHEEATDGIEEMRDPPLEPEDHDFSGWRRIPSEPEPEPDAWDRVLNRIRSGYYRPDVQTERPSDCNPCKEKAPDLPKNYGKEEE